MRSKMCHRIAISLGYQITFDVGTKKMSPNRRVVNRPWKEMTAKLHCSWFCLLINISLPIAWAGGKLYFKEESLSSASVSALLKKGVLILA